MKIFLPYRFSGEDPKELEKTLSAIRNALEKGGHEVFCSFWSEEIFRTNGFSNGQILEYALEKLRSADTILIFIKSNEKSEGMLLETGYALALKKKKILAIKNEIPTVFLRQIADELIEFDSLDDLCGQLKNLR
jgi:nucleoside 2-deoxyribosyltransferase